MDRLETRIVSNPGVSSLSNLASWLRNSAGERSRGYRKVRKSGWFHLNDLRLVLIGDPVAVSRIVQRNGSRRI